jgi:HTH-type transcriptional regulator/antitoxin HigA
MVRFQLLARDSAMAADGSPEADEREVLVTLIEAYENKHYPIQIADPIEAIKFRMDYP